MYRPLKIKIQLYLLFGIGLLFFSCNPDHKKSSDQSLSASKLDTINEWIKQGRNTDLSVLSRKENLRKAINTSESIDNDSLKTKIFSRVSLAYLILKDSLNFRKTNHETLRLAQKIEDSLSIAEAHWDLADFYRTHSITDSAYHHYLEANKIYESLHQVDEVGTMLNNMAIVQAGIKDYTGSEITTIKAIEIFKPLRNYEQLYNSYTNLGSVTKELKEYDRALEYYNTALEYQKKIKFKNNFDIDLKNNIGVVYQERGNFEESIPYFQQVLNTQSLIEKDPKSYAIALNNLAFSKSKINQNLDLSEQFKKAIQIQDSIGDITGLSRTHYSFADYYQGKNDTINALNQARKAQSYAQLSNNNDRVLQTLRLLTKLDPKNSSAYNQRYIALNDSLQEEERQIRDKFARIRFETDEYIAENVMLAREKQLWTGISFAVFLLGASAFVILNQRSKNQKLRFQQKQQVTNLEIFNLMLAQKQKEEEGKKSEQKRISEELHDGVLGKMMGARMVLTGLNKKSDSEAEMQRQQAIDALQDVEKEVRSISHALSHTAYQKINNFILSLQDLLESVEQTANINCNLVYDKNGEWDSLHAEIKINTYRMIQETLQNSVKHAQCKNVTVTFEAQKTGMSVSIADDGVGFRKIKRKKGIGMRNIASRMEKLNGQWHIDSTPGKGTTVILEIPLSFSEHPVCPTTKDLQLAQEV